MKKTLYILAISAVMTLTASAANFSGTLVDANCSDSAHSRDVPPSSPNATGTQTDRDSGSRSTDPNHHSASSSCNATSSTTSFALMANGKTYKLDSAGNTKAAAALKNRADRATDPAKATSAPAVNATVTGTESGGQIMVETLEVQ